MKEFFKVLFFFILISLSVSAMDAKHCNIAECSSNKLLKCLGCEAVYYCSKDHQKQDWPNHKESCRKIKKAWELLQKEASQESAYNSQRHSDGTISQLTKEEKMLLQSRLMKPLKMENDWDTYSKIRKVVFIAALKDSTSPKEAYEFSGIFFKAIWGSDYEQEFAQQIAKDRRILNSLLSYSDNKELAYLVFMLADTASLNLDYLFAVMQVQNAYDYYVEFMRNKNINVQDLIKLRLAGI